MIVDHKILFLLAFNYTFIDIERSRSFGIVTDRPEWVAEAGKLFHADSMRQPYAPGCDTFIVSPGNARRQLMGLLSGAKRQLLIYDDKLSDPDAMKLLAAKVRAGVDVRVIGTAGKRAIGVPVAPLFMRLHAQIIVRDGEQMFLGSQSLRSLELDARREVGALIDDPALINPVIATFEADWAKIRSARLPLPVLADEADLDREDLDDLDLDKIVAGDHPSPLLSEQIVKSVVKEAIKEALLETLTETATVAVPLKDAVKSAAKEALYELAL
jgi:phosphatidylserine/phosphatidylglycerophosphate/cardiolipin synthase-like enzyme